MALPEQMPGSPTAGKGVSGCRLYLVAPDPLPDDFGPSLHAALAAADIAALRLTTSDRAVVARVMPITREHGVALILNGPPALAASTGCDGAHIGDPDDAAAARRALGDLQLGVFCANSRDAAMRAGEAGADYVSFGPLMPDAGGATDLISWWADIMEVPAVAECATLGLECAALVRAGADFLAVGDAVWDDPRGPEEAVRALQAAIESV
jgi:thiamine-phosphate pyrophosphorylase